MTSIVKHVREKSWLATFPLLLASLCLHGLVLLVMALIGTSGPMGRGISGVVGDDSFSVTWIPGDGRGDGHARSKGVDTEVSDPEDGLEGHRAAVFVPEVNVPQVRKSPVLAVAHTDPQTVFNTDSEDSLRNQMESTDTTNSSRENVNRDRSKAIQTSQHNEVDFVATNQSDPQRIRTQRSNTLDTGDSDDQTADSIRKSAGIQGGKGVTNGGSDAGAGGTVGAGGTAGAEGTAGAGGNRIDFFGITTKGKRVVYVIDASESMRQHKAMEIARRHLWSSLQELTPTMQFQIVFFNIANHTMTKPGERSKLLAATSSNLRLAKQFLTGIQPDAGTDRFAAISLALSMEPDVIYLLTDADAPELSPQDLSDIRKGNKRKALIHVVEFGVNADLSRDSFLKKLTRQNSGTHFYHDLSKGER